MTSTRDSIWQAQEPSPGFAVRAVDAMLAAQGASKMRRRPRIVLYLAMAAVLATGTALAIAGARSGAHAQLAPDMSEPVVIGAANYSIRALAVATAAELTAVPLASSAPRRQIPSVSARSVKASPAPSVRVPLRQPACQCERGFSDFICDCF